jgi:His/Glu/Gln/Arg/opine family amino acid ABC transporter permease subunit
MGNAMMVFNPLIFAQYYPLFFRGIGYSLVISFSSLLIGIFGGICLGVILTGKDKFLRALAIFYVFLFRGTPMIIQLLLIFCFLPLLGVDLPPFVVASVAIGLNSIAYMSQVFKAGILGVCEGEIEAARVLGFSEWQIKRYIIFPQALKNCFPAFVSESITLMKDSALAHIIGVSELTFEANLVIAKTYDALSVYIIVGLMYLGMTGTLSLFFYFYERRFYASYYQ